MTSRQLLGIKLPTEGAHCLPGRAGPKGTVPFLGGGLLIAVVAILHAYIAHFAVGGGFWLVATERYGPKPYPLASKLDAKPSGRTLPPGAGAVLDILRLYGRRESNRAGTPLPPGSGEEVPLTSTPRMKN